MYSYIQPYSRFIVIHHVSCLHHNGRSFCHCPHLEEAQGFTRFPITWSCKHLISVCTAKPKIIWKLQGPKPWTSCLDTMPNDHLNPSNAAASAWHRQKFQCFPHSFCMSRQAFVFWPRLCSFTNDIYTCINLSSLNSCHLERQVAIWGQSRCEAESKVVTNGANISVGTP